MANNEILLETREIQNVRKVFLKDYGLLIITQGDLEQLVIEGQDHIIRQVKSQLRNDELHLKLEGGWFDKTWKAITSVVEGRSLTYKLTVKKLDGIFVSGAVRVKCSDLNFTHLKLTLKGAGEIIFNNIQGDRLEVDLPGAGIISLTGKVVEQDVHLRGAGSYDAPRLESQIGRVVLDGVGRATLWTTRQLDAKVDGLGSIDYYGDPDIRKSISGLGKIVQRKH